MIMAIAFRETDVARVAAAQTFAERAEIPGKTLLFLGTLVALLVSGTLKLDFLTATLFSIDFPWRGVAAVQQSLDRWVPVNEAIGAEGLSLQGAVLIGLLAGIGAFAWKGLGRVDEGFNRFTPMALGLTALTLVFAALGVRVVATGLAVTITGRTLAVAALCLALIPLARRFDAWDVQQWLWETWRFVKQIFPLLVVGVFLVGVIRVFIQPEWIRTVAGENTVLANLAGVVFGVFMYFPTLVEVPIAKMFLSLGMHPGPLIAYLMADPELSLQSILITAAIIGKLRAWSYVGLVALFSTVSGLTYGAWINGMPLGVLAAAVAGFVALIIGTLHVIETRRKA